MGPQWLQYFEAGRFGDWLRRRWRYIGLLSIGHGAKKVEEFLFDLLLYGTVVGWAVLTYGPVHGAFVGFVIMTPLSALLSMLFLRFYDWSKKDWLGFEALKRIRDGTETGLLARIARLGNVPAFFALSMYTDPFMTTIYLRKGVDTYNGLSWRDLGIFWSSVVVSNAYWTLRWTAIVAILEILWSWLYG